MSHVHYPCISGPAHGTLIGIDCAFESSLRGKTKVVTPQVNEHLILRIVAESRFNENLQTRLKGVLISFRNNLFTGLDFTLAVAIADKMARYTVCANHAMIYAVGRVVGDGRGRVDTVCNFVEHLHVIKKAGRSGDLVVYPEAEIIIDKTLDKEILNLESLGLLCIGIHHINQLHGLLWEQQITPHNDYQETDSCSDSTRGEV